MRSSPHSAAATSTIARKLELLHALATEYENALRAMARDELEVATASITRAGPLLECLTQNERGLSALGIATPPAVAAQSREVRTLHERLAETVVAAQRHTRDEQVRVADAKRAVRGYARTRGAARVDGVL